MSGAEGSSFSRMMEMEGVRRLDAPRHQGQRRQPQPARQQPAPASPPPAAPPPQGATATVGWATGETARSGLRTALGRLAGERSGGRGWATGIRQDGTAMVLSPRDGAATILAAADRHRLRLIVMGGEGWTFVLHPAMGVATLDDDPTED